MSLADTEYELECGNCGSKLIVDKASKPAMMLEARMDWDWGFDPYRTPICETCMAIPYKDREPIKCRGCGKERDGHYDAWSTATWGLYCPDCHEIELRKMPLRSRGAIKQLGYKRVLRRFECDGCGDELIMETSSYIRRAQKELRDEHGWITNHSYTEICPKCQAEGITAAEIARKIGDTR